MVERTRFLVTLSRKKRFCLCANCENSAEAVWICWTPVQWRGSTCDCAHASTARMRAHHGLVVMRIQQQIDVQRQRQTQHHLARPYSGLDRVNHCSAQTGVRSGRRIHGGSSLTTFNVLAMTVNG